MAKAKAADTNPQDSLRRMRADPVLFVKTVMGVDPTPQQTRILKAVARPGSRVSVRSGHGTGKSTTLAWLAFWFVGLRSDCRVPCTAPSKTQLYDVLWAEMAKWHSKMPDEWRKQFKLTRERLMLTSREQQSFAVARTSRKESPEALQGLHSPNMLFIIDEASGVFDEVFRVAEGALTTPGARVVMASNPTRTQGYFYDSHHVDRELWTTIHLNSMDSPLVDPKYAKRAEKKYGIQSSFYQVRVLGNFPLVAADQFIALALLDDAVASEIQPTLPAVWGVDPAYFGDNFTALAKRHGRVVTELKSQQNMDTMQSVGWIINEINQTPDDEKPEVIYVDATGMGAGISDRLRELGYPAIGINFASRPANSQQWGNMRTELWAMMRERLEGRMLRLPNDDRLLGEMSTTLYTFDSTGRLRLETKKEARNRGVDSPDHGDAVALTFYNEPAVGSIFGLVGGVQRTIDVEVDYDPLGYDAYV